MSYTSIALLVLAVVSCTNANINTLIPQGKELIYHYHGFVQAGTHLPTSFSSGFVLDGNLHMSSDQKSTFMQFSDLKFKMHNGEFDEWHEFENKELPLPKEMEDLLKPFKIMYNDDGTPMGIATGADEKHYIINIKKAIASIMQMDMKMVNIESKNHHAFHTEEETMYGKGKVNYNVMPSMMMIQKMQEPQSTRHMYTHMITSLLSRTCHAKYNEPLTRDNEKIYMLAKKDSGYVMQIIEAHSGLYHHLFGGQSDAYHIWMNQSFELTDMLAMKPMEITGEKIHKGFTYRVTDFENIDGPFPDMTNGRRTWDMDKLMGMIETLMHDLVEYIKGDNIKTELPDKKHTELINRLKRLMLYLDLDHLNKMHEGLLAKTSETDKEILNIYYQMLPLIGSHSAMYHIKTLILAKKVKDRMAINMLEKMPFYVQFPNQKLMDNMAEMMHWEDKVDNKVRTAAILAFTTLIHQALDRHDQYQHKNVWFGFDHEHDFMTDVDPEEKIFPGEKYYEKYLIELMTMLKGAKDEDTKVMCLMAMYNTRLTSLKHHLMPIAKGEMFEGNNFLRLLAAVAMKPVIAHNEDLMFEVFWPIMSCPHMATPYKILAYYHIMSTQPSLQRLINIFWHMNVEDNYALYQFHYTFMEIHSRTTDPCMEMFKTNIKQIMRYSMKPAFHGMTGFYQIDYTDKYDFGQTLSWLVINTRNDNEKFFVFSMKNEFENLQFVPLTVIIRISGVEGTFADDLKLDLKSLTTMYNWDELLQMYKTMMDNKDFKLDIMMMHYDQMIMLHTYDHTNIKDIFSLMKMNNEDKFIKKLFMINYSFSTTIMVPTEMGFPAAYQEYMPTMYFSDLNMAWENANKIYTLHIDNHLKSMSHGRIGLSFYNPIADVWQGVTKRYIMDSVYPLLMDISFNPQQQSLKLSMKRHDEPIKDVIGMRSHVTNVVFVMDDMEHDILKQSCPECHGYEMVSFGDDYRHEMDLLDNDCSNTGMHYKIKMFDSERHVSNMTMQRLHNIINMRLHANYHTAIGHYILNKMNFMMLVQFQPHPATNGIMFRYEPSKTHQITNIDMMLRVNKEYKQKDWHLMPAVKANMRATYSIKNKEQTLKTWDANLVIENNLGHTMKTMKMYISRMIPGQKDFKMCADGTMKFEDDKMNAMLNFATTQAPEGKCSKEDQIMEIKLLAEKSQDQLEDKHIYTECTDFVWSDLHKHQPMSCYAAYSSLRKYTYDIKMMNMPTEFKKRMGSMLDWIKGMYMPYFTHMNEPTMKLEDNTMKVIMEYPMDEPVVDAHIITPENEYKFDGIPTKQWLHSRMMHPYNTQYSSNMKMLHNLGLMRQCFIGDEEVENVMDKELTLKLPTEWTMYFGDTEADSKHGVWAKKIEGTDKIAMKIMHQTHSLEIIPNGKIFDIIIDGKKMDEKMMHHSEDWFHYDYIKKTDVVALVSHHLGSFMLFDGHHIWLEFPQADMHYYGHCFDEVKQG